MEEDVVDTTKMMGLYGRLSANKLKESTVEAFKKQVEDDVKTAQEKADQVVNALTSRQTAPDFSIVRGALVVLLKSNTVIVKHWQPFVEAVNELLPPLAEGELVIPEADDFGKKERELNEMVDKLVTPLGISSGAELRIAFDTVVKLKSAVDREMEKRGLKGAEVDMEASLADLAARLTGAEARAEALQRERDAAQQTRLEMSQACEQLDTTRVELLDKLRTATESLDVSRQQLASTDTALKQMTADLDAEMKRNTELELKIGKDAEVTTAALKEMQSSLLAEKKRAGELEHEVEQLKKKSKKQ